jgi:hypothetical protein
MDEEFRKIFEELNYVAAQKRTVNLITNFRGVPINLTASIIRCSQASGGVRLSVHHRQIVSLKAADQLLIQSNLFPKIVVADIVQVDLYKQIIFLNNLRYVTGSMGNRKNVRVQPENPLHAEIITDHGFNILGEIIDISLDGLSVYLEKVDLPGDELFSPQARVEVRLGLPGPDKKAIHDIAVSARVAYTKHQDTTLRMGLITSLNEVEQHVMRRYIFDRQTEILNEIQQMNGAMLEAV